MKKLRWVTDMEGVWELDASTARTLEGVARPVPETAVPLGGVSRGSRLSRDKQIDFFQRFMFSPFLPSFSPHSALSLHRSLTLPFPFSPSWLNTVLGQFNVQKFVSSVKGSGDIRSSASSWLQSVGRHLKDKSLYALGFCSELLLSPDDTLFVSFDRYAENDSSRKKVVYNHKFPNHDLTMETVWPGLFLDKAGNYWDVPFLAAVNLASLSSESGASYNLSMFHTSGSPKKFDGEELEPPFSLLPGLSLKGAFALKRDAEFWRSNARKLQFVQPYDIFLSNPLVSASGTIGAALSASFRNGSEQSFQGFRGLSFESGAMKSFFAGDLFGSLSVTAQHGNFQRLFLDLTRFQARMDFPSGSKFLSGAVCLAQDFVNSNHPRFHALQAVCPNTRISLQQQIVGPFSFKVESEIAVNFGDGDWNVRVQDPIFAIEHSLHVLGSAKAIAWYSPKHREFMVELRFAET